MKRILILLGLIGLLGVCTAPAQTTNTVAAENLWDILTTGSNYFAVPFGTFSTGSKTFGGGIALGYKATEALAPVLRFEGFAGQAYLANVSLQLSVPRRLMGKLPLVPFLEAGAGIPLTTETIDGGFTISAGQPVGIIGSGLYMPLDWMGKAGFLQRSFLAMSFEHWSGAGIPQKESNQFRFGYGIKF